MIKKLIKLPLLRRLIPSILIRYYRLINKSRKFYQIGDINFYLDFLDPMDREIILHKVYEKNQIAFLEKRMNDNSFSHFFDIGSNSGYYSFYFANKLKDIKINSFEPNMEAYNKFLKTLKKNSFKNVELFKFGLSDTEKKIQTWSLIKNEFIQSNSTIINNQIGLNSKNIKIDLNSKNIKIKDIYVKAGDNIFNFNDEKLCFKIDVEGHEIYTLEGLLGILNNNKCLILIEIWDFNFNKVNEFFKNIDYNQIHHFEDTSYYVFSNFK